MNIAISGASGFVGRHLSAFFMQSGHQVLPLGRSLFNDNGYHELVSTLSKSDVVLNLAGMPINRRWTSAYKGILYASRISVTRQIVNALKDCSRKPQLLISASAVGYYPTQGGYDETDKVYAEGFLAELCRQWEYEALKCPTEVRVAIARLGVVLSPDGGALRSMLLPVKMKVVGMILPGTQLFPWISITDLCRAMLFIIQTPSMHGPINFTAPDFITHQLLAEAILRHYRAWLIMPIPRFVFKVIYGEAASFLLSGQCVNPLRLTEEGFQFTYPTIEHFWDGQK